jgi:hypothetical protein
MQVPVVVAVEKIGRQAGRQAAKNLSRQVSARDIHCKGS